MSQSFVQKFMQLYKKNKEGVNMDKRGYLMQYDCLTGDEYKLWYIASRCSSLIEINRITGEAKELFSLKKEGQYRSLIKDENKLLLIPAETRNFWVYNIKNGKTRSYLIPDEMFCEGYNWSAKYIRWGKYIYFNWASPVIVKYDLLSGEWQLFTKWRDLIPEDIKYENWFPNKSFFYDGFLYFQIGTSQMMLRLNPDNNDFDVFSLCVPECVVSIDNTGFSNDELWIECKNDNGTISIYCCKDWNTYRCEKILDLNMDVYDNGSIRIFSIIEKIGDKLLLLPGNYDKTYLIDVKARKVHICDQYPIVSRDKLKFDWFSAFNYYRGLRLEGHFLVMHPWTHQLIEISGNGNSVRKIPVIFSEEILDRIINQEFETTLIHDEGFLDLKDLLDYESSGEKVKIKTKNFVGQVIYEALDNSKFVR